MVETSSVTIQYVFYLECKKKAPRNHPRGQYDKKCAVNCTKRMFDIVFSYHISFAFFFTGGLSPKAQQRYEKVFYAVF